MGSISVKGSIMPLRGLNTWGYCKWGGSRISMFRIFSTNPGPRMGPKSYQNQCAYYMAVCHNWSLTRFLIGKTRGQFVATFWLQTCWPSLLAWCAGPVQLQSSLARFVGPVRWPGSLARFVGTVRSFLASCVCPCFVVVIG